MRKEGALFTHTIDSITRKAVGKFAPAGIHINRNEYLPLPTLPIISETRNNTADSIATDFRLLVAARGISAEEIDVHMTDSTSHNKGITENLAATEKKRNFTEKKIAGQIFCNSHTKVRFDKGTAKTIHSIENKIRMQNIFSGFLLDIDIDQRKDSVSINYFLVSRLSCCLGLFGPENINKSWNYYKDFCKFLQSIAQCIYFS